MSYYEMSLIPIQQGTPGWQDAPVPSWGVNPLNAGPPRVGIGCPGGCGADEADYNRTTWGHVAAAAAGALVVGLLVGYYAGKPKMAKNRRGGVYKKMKANVKKRIGPPLRGKKAKRKHAAWKAAQTRKRRAELAKWSRSPEARAQMRATRKATKEARYYDSGL